MKRERLTRSYWHHRRARRKLRVLGERLCPACAGTGRLGPPGGPTCPSCRGRGMLPG